MRSGLAPLTLLRHINHGQEPARGFGSTFFEIGEVQIST
jgi:hypothetical protein